MRQVGLAATARPTRHRPLAHPKQTQPRPLAHPPARCPGNSQPPSPSQPQRLDWLYCQEPATAGSPNQNTIAGLAKMDQGTIPDSIIAPCLCSGWESLPESPSCPPPLLKPLGLQAFPGRGGFRRIRSFKWEAKGDTVARGQQPRTPAPLKPWLPSLRAPGGLMRCCPQALKCHKMEGRSAQGKDSGERHARGKGSP